MQKHAISQSGGLAIFIVLIIFSIVEMCFWQYNVLAVSKVALYSILDAKY